MTEKETFLVSLRSVLQWKVTQGMRQIREELSVVFGGSFDTPMDGFVTILPGSPFRFKSPGERVVTGDPYG